MPDQIFENPRLAAIYDAFDGQRLDLEMYISLVNELGARSVLDVGCGTGCLAVLLAESGIDVTALEPAQASLGVARKKRHAQRVRWIRGVAEDLPSMTVDLAVMTGNVAQVFLTDEDWHSNLLAIRKSLHPHGHLVFEVRNPAQKAWLGWTREKTYERRNIPGEGSVEAWCEVAGVAGSLVTFRWTYKFEFDGSTVISDSTLRFRERMEVEESLERAGFSVKEIRDAPDRPGKEWVFLATVK